MNRNVIAILSIFILTACKSKKYSNCTIPYTMGNLLKRYDSSRFRIQKDGNWTSVFDRGDPDNKNIDRGFYSFDQNNVLRSYQFLFDDSFFRFQIKFDSLGRETTEPDKDVVLWNIQKKGPDSVRVSFFLFQINRSYSGIILTTEQHLMPVTLHVSKYFSNLAGAEKIISNFSSGIFFLKGIIRDDCSGRKKNFCDSLNISDILAKRRNTKH
jgi:hypothetical protein